MMCCYDLACVEAAPLCLLRLLKVKKLNQSTSTAVLSRALSTSYTEKIRELQRYYR
jgi:hypothetical protein